MIILNMYLDEFILDKLYRIVIKVREYMEYLEAIKSLILGMVSNAAYDQLKGHKSDELNSSQQKLQEAEAETPHLVSFPVQSLYAYYGEHSNDWFLPLVNHIHEPNVYIFLETEASTFYNLGLVVLEDNRTNDWYPFYKSVALQGSGGGWKNTERLYKTIQDIQNSGKKISVSLRVANNSDTKLLEAGQLYWSEYKQKTIPALICKDETISKLQARFFKDIVQIG